MPCWDDGTPGGNLRTMRFYRENSLPDLVLIITFVGSVYLGYLLGGEGCKIAWKVTLVYRTESV